MLKNVSRSLFVALLGAGMIAATVVPAQAERPCERRVRQAEMHYREAVRRHGARSRQAEHYRHELENARARCH
jgi:hypothetical protein